LRYDKFSIVHIAFVTLISFSLVVIGNTEISSGQTMSSGQQQVQQAPPMGVKILSPSKDDNSTIVNNTNDFEIYGTSTDNTNTDCKVSIILNNIKPYQEAIPTGPGGEGDYSAWSFSLNPNYNATIKEGSNKLTAKQTCTNPNKFASSDLAKYYSVFFNGVSDGSNGGNSRAAETPPTSNSISALQQQGEIEIKQQQEQKQPPSSIATSETPLKDNDTIAQLSTPSPKPADVVNEQEKSAINTPTNSTTDNSSTGPQTTKTMTFAIHQEGKLGASSEKTEQTGIISTQNVASASSSQNVLPSANSCNENLPISRFSAIGDDGDDAVPQNAFDNNLQTRWSHNSVGSWILVDLGSSKAVCFVDIAWYRGSERSYDFIISLSEDGINFKDVHTSTSTGNSLSPERYTVVDSNPSSSNQATAAENARYIRITVNGNTESDTDQNQWAAITEIDVNGSDDTGRDEILQKSATAETLEGSSSTSLEQTGEQGGDTMVLKISGIYETQNENTGSPPAIDPSRLEGILSVVDSTTNKKIEEYDLAPINIAFTQLFKKITVTTGIDDPILNGTITSTLKFPSSVDLHSEGSYTSDSNAGNEETVAESRGTVGNMLLAKIGGEQTYSILGNTSGSITIKSLDAN
jgi:F5/8 type C domain